MTHVELAQSDVIGGKNCNHGGAVSEANKAAKAERDAAKLAGREAKWPPTRPRTTAGSTGSRPELGFPPIAMAPFARHRDPPGKRKALGITRRGPFPMGEFRDQPRCAPPWRASRSPGMTVPWFDGRGWP